MLDPSRIHLVLISRGNTHDRACNIFLGEFSNLGCQSSADSRARISLESRGKARQPYKLTTYSLQNAIIKSMRRSANDETVRSGYQFDKSNLSRRFSPNSKVSQNKMHDDSIRVRVDRSIDRRTAKQLFCYVERARMHRIDPLLSVKLGIDPNRGVGGSIQTLANNKLLINTA